MGPPKVQFGRSRRKPKQVGRKRKQKMLEKQERRQKKANEDKEKRDMQQILEKTWEEFEKSLSIVDNNHESRMFGDKNEMEGSGGSMQRAFGFQEGSGNTGFSSEPLLSVNFPDNEFGIEGIVKDPPSNTPAPIIMESTQNTETHSIHSNASYRFLIVQ